MKVCNFEQPIPLNKLIHNDDIFGGIGSCAQDTVRRLSWHSNFVEGGDVFLLIPTLEDQNHVNDKKNFSQAYQKGAQIFVVQDDFPVPVSDETLKIIRVANMRRMRSQIAQRAFPGQPDNIVAVTGTNGKTSTVQFCYQLWQLLGYQSASLGTLGLKCKLDLNLDHDNFSLTSVDPFVLHQALSVMKSQGMTHLALEASSHGLDQHRLDAVNFTAAGFTNLSQDHLDYHQTMSCYLKAKVRLFSEILKPGCSAIVNADIPEFDQLNRIAQNKDLRVLSYGSLSADFQLQQVSRTLHHQIATFNYRGQTYEIKFNFFSHFQVMNALCALGLVIECGAAPQQVIPLLKYLKPVSGRLEMVALTRTQARVFIDYAHKPEALREVLTALRHYVTGRLYVVFGCGGNRDKGKRPLMGKIAHDYADVKIITDDNPRFEDPQLIRKSILVNVPNGIEIPNRATAIATALDLAVSGDVVLIAGKGHENYQIIKDQKIDFSDRQHIINYINKNGGRLAS